ncbi:MAG: hypothetical protein ACOCYZ_01460 [Halococcoides sp.]
MTVAEWPLIADLVEAGARDPIFDALLLAGPVLIGLIALTNALDGPTAFVRLLAIGYVVAFVAAIGYRVVESRTDR